MTGPAGAQTERDPITHSAPTHWNESSLVFAELIDSRKQFCKTGFLIFLKHCVEVGHTHRELYHGTLTSLYQEEENHFDNAIEKCTFYGMRCPTQASNQNSADANCPGNTGFNKATTMDIS